MPSRQPNPLHQTYVPHVEFLINGENILLSSGDQKPKRLVSFSHTIAYNGNGPFRLEIFDPDFTEVERRILTIHAADYYRAQLATKAEKDSGVPDNQLQVTNPVTFRYGYTSEDGNVLSSSPSGHSMFAGTILQYTPIIQQHGVQIIIEGFSSAVNGANHARKMCVDAGFYNRPPYEIIEAICEQQGWELRDINNPTSLGLPPEQQPRTVTDTGQAVDSTEEQPRSFKPREDATPYQAIQDLCERSRPVGQQYGVYQCRLEYAATDKDVAGILYYGPESSALKPVREYVYLRDKDSDVISYAPTIRGWPNFVTGAAGMVHNSMDVRSGELNTHQLSELDKFLKEQNQDRVPVGQAGPNTGQVQQGTPENPEDSEKIEDTVQGKVIAPKHKIPPDFLTLEMSVSDEHKVYVDDAMMDYWLRAARMATMATLEIFGDPDPLLTPGQLIDVFVLVPTAGDKFAVHYTSNRWRIMGVVHQISGGSFTTTMELGILGFEFGEASDEMTASKSAIQQGLSNVLGQGASQVSTPGG